MPTKYVYVSSYEEALRLGGQRFADQWQSEQEAKKKAPKEQKVTRSIRLSLTTDEWVAKLAASRGHTYSATAEALITAQLVAQGTLVSVPTSESEVPVKSRRKF